MHKARFLVNTDIIINYLKGRGNARVYDPLVLDAECCLTVEAIYMTVCLGM